MKSALLNNIHRLVTLSNIIFIVLITNISITVVANTAEFSYYTELSDSPLNTSTSDDIPDLITIDNSKAVGEINIISGTTPSGGKTYQIPFELNNGMNGFAPQIGLIYNSQAGNSIIGMGWSLSGISKISRVSKNIYYDRETKSIELNKSDAFELDGVRLIPIPLQSTSSYNLYQTEEGNIKVKGFLNSDDISYFEVYYPDGKKSKFGVGITNFSNIHYAISSAEDLFNNEIYFSYLTSCTYPIIEKISYNGNSLQFSYETRSDKITEYIAGQTLSMSYRLKSIKIKEQASEYTYTLSYTMFNNRSLLCSLDYGNFYDSINPLYFYYGTTNKHNTSFSQSTSILTQWLSTEDTYSINLITGKFDYENDSDGLIEYSNKNPYYVKSNGGYYFENMYKPDEKNFDSYRVK